MIHERFILIHGCDITCKIHVATSSIDGKRSAIELETCFILDIDIATRRFDNTIVLARARAAKERCAICARRQRTATRADIGIDVDAALIITICISIEDNIQWCRCMDIRINVDTFLCFQRQCIFSNCRLINIQSRRQRDICIVIGRIRRLDLDIILLQDIGDRRGLQVSRTARICITAAMNRSRFAIINNDYLSRVEQPLACFAGLACCVDVDVIADLEIVAGGLDEAAVYCADCMERRSVLDVCLCADSLDRACTLPGLHAGCIKRAVQLDNAVIAAVQKDLTLLVLTQGLCFHRARVVDDRAHDIAGTPCRHDEIAAICLEHTAVERLCLGKCTVNGEIDLACRIGGQAEVTRCCKSRRTLGIRDRAAVLDFCRMQHDEATLCADRTGVDDLSRRILGNRHRDAVCIRKVRHIAVADPRRRSDERTNVNTGVLAEQHAVGVDDIDMSVARERAIDDGCSIADHAVQCYRVFVRLTEGHTLVVRDVKARPVDCQAFGILVDRHVLVLTRDLALTGTDDFTLRHRIRNTADRHRHHRSGNRCGLALPSLSSSHRSFHFGSPLFVFNA